MKASTVLSALLKQLGEKKLITWDSGWDVVIVVDPAGLRMIAER